MRGLVFVGCGGGVLSPPVGDVSVIAHGTLPAGSRPRAASVAITALRPGPISSTTSTRRPKRS
jgi:hypothetical protein